MKKKTWLCVGSLMRTDWTSGPSCASGEPAGTTSGRPSGSAPFGFLARLAICGTQNRAGLKASWRKPPSFASRGRQEGMARLRGGLLRRFVLLADPDEILEHRHAGLRVLDLGV